MRSCTKCGALRPLTEFRFNKSKGRPSAACKECERAYQREWYARNPEEGRAKAARSMRKMRADPTKHERLLEKQRAHYHEKGKHTERAYYARIRENDPWGWRVRNLRRNINPNITIEWLRSLWDAQRGRCALTGRDLDIRTAELDHIVPKSRGGTNELDNLRLTVSEANYAKGAMTDAEFLALCRDVIRESQIPELIGRAIAASMEAA